MGSSAVRFIALFPMPTICSRRCAPDLRCDTLDLRRVSCGSATGILCKALMTQTFATEH